ncbi:MAG: thioredoxin domain-containing protein [Syntrophaceae bacterium]|nr:thioredoxin domain-containing protein [Syntrophaceae bacterium]
MEKRKKLKGTWRTNFKSEQTGFIARGHFWFLAFLLMASLVFSPPFVEAEVEWRVLKNLDLNAKPLDIATSTDGKWLFILTPGEVLIFSVPEGTISDRIPVDKEFDRIAPLPRPDLISLTSGTKNSLQVIQFAPIYAFDLTSLPIKGPQDAFVTLAVFDDYQCPYCARLESTLRQVVEKYPNDVKLVIKHFPLSSHEYARKAAVAALAAGRQGKFWEIHEKLFASQNELNDAKVDSIAGEIGLDMERFKKDLQDPAIASLIDRDLKDGNRANIPGTPAVFLNGKLLNLRGPDALYQAIDAELKKKKK